MCPSKTSATGGGTLGCNWQALGSRFVFGAEGETGLYAAARERDQSLQHRNNDDTLDETVIGNWYGSIAGRAGWATDRAWFYAKAGAGFTERQVERG